MDTKWACDSSMSRLLGKQLNFDPKHAAPKLLCCGDVNWWALENRYNSDLYLHCIDVSVPQWINNIKYIIDV